MILTDKYCFPSARLLRDAIREVSGRKLAITSDPNKLRGKRLHVRYGNSHQTPVLDTMYNSSDAISFLASKRTFSNCLLDAGFASPNFIRSREPNPDEYPVLIRTSLYLCGGRGIYPCFNRDEFRDIWRSDYWWCSYLETSSEFRVHITKSRTGSINILRMLKKIPRNVEAEEQRIKIRHLENYTFSRRFNPEERYPKMFAEILRMMEIVPGRFFALDVGWSRHLSRTVFYEANTAPGLDNASALSYAQFLRGEEVL